MPSYLMTLGRIKLEAERILNNNLTMAVIDPRLGWWVGKPPLSEDEQRWLDWQSDNHGWEREEYDEDD